VRIDNGIHLQYEIADMLSDYVRLMIDTIKYLKNIGMIGENK
jgi:hypothetical protein